MPTLTQLTFARHVAGEGERGGGKGGEGGRVMGREGWDGGREGGGEGGSGGEWEKDEVLFCFYRNTIHRDLVVWFV